MKILYIAPGDHMDYQNDSLIIGLKEVLGGDVVDINKHHHIYSSFPAEVAATMYGKGMTVTRVVPDDACDRTDIEHKIRTRFFDMVVYGSIWRCQDHLGLVRECYPGDRIALVDGEDEPLIHPFAGYRMHYFKRELALWEREHSPGIHPIGFAFPTSKVSFDEPKTRDLAICDPRDTSTYIYGDEASYYRGYGEARYAVTIKKAGWDCMRHYEILGNGCIPLFLDIAGCPQHTMDHFPKERCLQVLHEQIDADTFERHAEYFRDVTRRHLTTSALATRFIDTVMSAGAAGATHHERRAA